MKYSRFVIYKNLNGQYYFRLFNNRGKLLLTGEPCEIRFQCVTTIQDMLAVIQLEHHYKIFTAPGQFSFQIISDKKKVVAKSEVYRTMPGMAYGMQSVKKNVSIAIIEDSGVNVRFFTNR